MKINSKTKRKNRRSSKPNVADIRIAIVTATISQLAEIGIDEDLAGKEVKVYDVDKYGGMYPPCSRIVVDNKFDWLAAKGINADYIFPTRWLSLS